MQCRFYSMLRHKKPQWYFPPHVFRKKRKGNVFQRDCVHFFELLIASPPFLLQRAIKSGNCKRVSFLRSWHSQTTMTCHPSASSAESFFASRSALCWSLSCQKPQFDAGIVAFLHPGWRCQKHPRTSITVLYFGRTISGRPGRSFAWTQKRKPCQWRYDRTTISGFVSLPWTWLMFRLRCSFVKWSMISSHLISSNSCSKSPLCMTPHFCIRRRNPSENFFIRLSRLKNGSPRGFPDVGGIHSDADVACF